MAWCEGAAAEIDLVGILRAALADLLSAQVDVNFDTVPTVLSHIKSGRLRPLAVTTRARVASLPGVPTVLESGVPGYEIGAWYMLMGPAALPRDIRTRLSQAMTDVLKTPDVREKLVGLGTEIAGGTPERMMNDPAVREAGQPARSGVAGGLLRPEVHGKFVGGEFERLAQQRGIGGRGGTHAEPGGTEHAIGFRAMHDVELVRDGHRSCLEESFLATTPTSPCQGVMGD